MKFLHTYYSPAMTREYIEGWLACGPPAAVVAKIRAYVDAGCTTPILRFASWDQKGQLARALAEVMPAALALRVPDSSTRQLGMQAVTVISISSSGEFSDATVTVVRAGLLVGKYFAYSSL